MLVSHNHPHQKSLPGHKIYNRLVAFFCLSIRELSAGDFARHVPTGPGEYPVSPFPAGHDEKAYISQFFAVVMTQAKACGYRLLLALA
jgi:hypothetical protein